ncbi:MAG: DUF1697 domain-containing protein [Candidatus Moranbacteria bacterium]|nr:DUF1697 domain-containing protein [Candidatus Moranbacteria bacterium]
MHTYIALLRGINVNGQKMMSMEKLRTLLEDLGFTGVTTYIQSGNVVFQSGKAPHFTLEKKIKAAISDMFGFSVSVMVKTANEWSGVVKKNPFLGRVDIDESKLHVTFLSDTPNQATVDEILAGEYGSDECIFSGKTVYLFCPNGYGKTKLNNSFFEKKTSLIATTRNWKTALKLLELSI